MLDSEKKLTIVHTEASNGWGGQEIRILTESKWFRKRGYNIIIATSRESKLGEIARKEGFEVEYFALRKSSVISDIIRLAIWLRKIKPDVLATHSSEDSWAGLIAGRIAKVPVLIRYRHVSVPLFPNIANRLLYRSLCDKIITTADCISRELIEKIGVPLEKVSTIPTGIDPYSIEITNLDRFALAKKLNLSEAGRFIGCIAVLRSWKGHNVLMQAFEKISAQFPEHHLVIMGDGPAMEGLKMLQESLSSKSRIHFMGHQQNPHEWLKAFDIIVLASIKNEGIPQSLLQAMFAGVPVVGTNAGGIPEIVIDGKTGWLAEAGSIESLAQKLTDAILNRDEALRRAENAKKFVNENFTLEKMGSAVESLMIDFLKSNRTQSFIPAGKSR